MEIKGDLLRGNTDAIILAILEKNDSYGYEINTIIDNESNHALVLTEATMYTAFKRLENSQYIISYWQDGPHIKRKYYSITESGRKYLREYRESLKYTMKTLVKLVGGDNYGE